MSFVEWTEKDQVAYLKLNRPEVRNAFDPVMISEITVHFNKASKRSDLRIIILQGEGKVFCAGADLNWMKEMVEFSLQQNQEDSLKLHEMFESIYVCPIPVIGLVQGAAFGGALGLVAVCDYVIADPDTKFCFSEVKLGIVPAVISTFVLRKTNPGKVRHWMMSGSIFDGKQAKDAGLVHELADVADFKTQLETHLKAYAECGPEAVRATKCLLNDLPGLSGSIATQKTTQLIAERRVSAEGQEGLKSFLEKRRPDWRRP